MADVFISYKSERRRAARHLEQILIQNGYSVWFDHALVRGHDYEEQIQREIAAAKAVIVLWCSMSVESGAVRSEASFAKGKNKQIPIKIEACDIPLFSSLTQFADLAAWSGAPRDVLFDAVLDDVEMLVGRKPVYDRDLLRAFERTWRDNGAFTLATFPLETVIVPQATLHLSGGVASQPGQQSETLLAIAAREWPSIRDSREEARLLRFEQHFKGTYYAEEARELREALAAEQQAKEELKQRIFAEGEARKAAVAAYKAEGRIQVDAKTIHGAPEGWFKPGAGKSEWFKDHDAGPRMAVLPAGTFQMGSADGEGGDDERPQHVVSIAKPFAVGIAPVTRAEYAAFIAATKHGTSGGAFIWKGTTFEHDANGSWRDPGFPQGEDHPVVCASWHDAQTYVAWLRKVTGNKPYRLLSEAEWEYCCRATTPTPYSTGPTINKEQANFGQNNKGTTPVSRFPTNLWGLHDMHGNVWEWVEDTWHSNYQGAPNDGSVWQGGDTSLRVLRGGSWDFLPRNLRSASRSGVRPDFRIHHLGFRLARTL